MNKKLKSLLALGLATVFNLSIVNSSYAIVNKSIESYEEIRVKKGLNPEPFSIKTIKNNIFERTYNLGGDVVVRVFTSVNVKKARVFRADLFIAKRKPLPSSESDINNFITVLAGKQMVGIPKVSSISLDDGKVEVLDYLDLKVMKIRDTENRIIMVRVMNKSECKRLDFC